MKWLDKEQENNNDINLMMGIIIGAVIEKENLSHKVVKEEN